MATDIENVHYAVLSNFVWQTDMKTFGRIEHWDRPKVINGVMYGDCDDFSIECFYRLMDLGYEPHLAVCNTSGGEGIDHCVCLCGEWVLDNRYRWPYKLSESSYTNWSRDNGNWADDWISFTLE